jgi:hypothetical protein
MGACDHNGYDEYPWPNGLLLTKKEQPLANRAFWSNLRKRKAPPERGLSGALAALALHALASP